MKNTAQNKLLEVSPLGFDVNFGASPRLERYLLHAEPYCAVDTNLADTGLG